MIRKLIKEVTLSQKEQKVLHGENYMMVYFSVTNYHKLSGLKKTLVYYLVVLEVRSLKWVSLMFWTINKE